MSILVLTSDTLIGTPATGNIEYNGQFFGTDSNASRAQLQRITLSSQVTLTNQTAPEFTGIPAWAKKISILISGLSTNGASNYLIQGGSGSYEISGYLGASTSTAASASTTNFTTGFGISNGGTAATNVIHGIGTMILLNASTNLWAFNLVCGNSDSTRAVFSGGSKAFSGTLDRIRFYVDGTQQFDAGSINILIEG